MIVCNFYYVSKEIYPKLNKYSKEKNNNFKLVSVGQTISKANHGFLNSPKKRIKITILSKEDAQDS